MNITALLAGSNSTLTGSGSGSTAAQTTATAAASSVSPQLSQAQKRIQADVDSTTAQLSQFGLLKSALADAQTRAKALSGLGTAATPPDVTQALGTFFKAFNSSVGAANTAASASGSALASSNARRVVQDLKSALRADPATDAALKKLGLTVQSDGSLLQDAHKFANALAADPAGVRAALATVGKKVDAVNSRELASNGTVGSALSNLNQHSSTLTAQQSALKSLQTAMAAYQANSSTA
jgi:hypothetical protein